MSFSNSLIENHPNLNDELNLEDQNPSDTGEYFVIEGNSVKRINEPPIVKKVPQNYQKSFYADRGIFYPRFHEDKKKRRGIENGQNPYMIEVLYPNKEILSAAFLWSVDEDNCSSCDCGCCCSGWEKFWRTVKVDLMLRRYLDAWPFVFIWINTFIALLGGYVVPSLYFAIKSYHESCGAGIWSYIIIMNIIIPFVGPEMLYGVAIMIRHRIKKKIIGVTPFSEMAIKNRYVAFMICILISLYGWISIYIVVKKPDSCVKVAKVLLGDGISVGMFSFTFMSIFCFFFCSNESEWTTTREESVFWKSSELPMHDLPQDLWNFPEIRQHIKLFSQNQPPTEQIPIQLNQGMISPYSNSGNNQMGNYYQIQNGNQVNNQNRVNNNNQIPIDNQDPNQKKDGINNDNLLDNQKDEN